VIVTHEIQPSRDVRILSRITNFVSTTHSIAAFLSFMVFLVNGRYRTLVDRILRIRLAPPSSQVSREVSFEYLNRQLVWHAFTEFLLFLLPLVGISRWRRWVSRAWRKTVAAVRASDDDDGVAEKLGQLAFLPERTCAICYQEHNPTSTSESDLLGAAASAGGIIGSAQTDITNPYETVPCGCIYCFVCITEKLEGEEGEGWICLRCGELVKQCKPWNGDVLEEVRRSSGSGKNVGFAVAADPEETEAVEEETFESEMEKNSPLQGIDTDETLQGSNTWSTVERELTPDTETNDSK
jgi:peroxin-2